ncbi:MAG TPA: hypothetical protein VF942_10425 [Acidimicrobiales bacterium]
MVSVNDLADSAAYLSEALEAVGADDAAELAGQLVGVLAEGGVPLPTGAAELAELLSTTGLPTPQAGPAFLQAIRDLDIPNISAVAAQLVAAMQHRYPSG